MEWTSERGLGGSLMTGKKPQSEPPLTPPAAKALVLDTMVKPNKPCPEAAESTKQIPLEEDNPAWFR